MVIKNTVHSKVTTKYYTQQTTYIVVYRMYRCENNGYMVDHKTTI